MQSRSAHRRLRNKRTFLWLSVAAVIVALDWYTKQWAGEALSLHRPEPILSWLNLTLVHNTGAAFSLLSEAGGWQRWLFTALAVGVTLVLLVWLFRLEESQWATGLALGLVTGGAVGNLLDRLRLGYVVDFIDVHYADWHWPAFNVADSAITCGIIVLLIDAAADSLRERRQAGRAEN